MTTEPKPVETDEEIIDLVANIQGDQAAAEYAQEVALSRSRILALALNLSSIYAIHQVNAMSADDIRMGESITDEYLDIAHEPLDRAVRSHAELLDGR